MLKDVGPMMVIKVELTLGMVTRPNPPNEVPGCPYLIGRQFFIKNKNGDKNING